MAKNGRPEADVIASFQDGFSYSKKRLDEAFASGVFDVPSKKKKDTHAPDVKLSSESIDLIVHELEIPRSQAEKALAEHKGDVVAALKALVTPK
ncbi:hypothetical protein BS47DRAFT_918575 [Hydnum rufescens UP504]|uniref:Nascent polypeptide-associated complex subunit alpha-like UBA domain-containing protein n=1 Tax=Hydnum rufescens UP504 TaxID=1448309 RepID=A0A9P6DYZ0_9AGAM|nr:hypothetical protein BS47DRAFT_918575 [Hydnum rufescens UP504]